MSKFTVSRKALADELAFIKNAISGKVNPKWGFITFEAADDKLTLTGTDGNATAQTSIKLDKPVEQPESFAILGPTIVDLVSKFDDVDSLNFSVAETKTTVSAEKSGRYSYTHNPEAIEAIKKQMNIVSDGKGHFQMLTANFASCLKVVGMFAAREDKTQWNMSGVQLEANEENLNMAAMDHNCSIDITVEEKAVGRNNKIFIARDFFGLIGNITNANAAAEVDVAYDDVGILINCGARQAILRQIAVNTPPVRNSITKRVEQSAKVCTAPAKELAKKLNRAATLVTNKLKKVSVNIEPDLLKVWAVTSDGVFGEGDETIEIKTDQTMTAMFNAETAVDFLKLVDGDVDIYHVVKVQTAGGLIMTDKSGMRYMMSLMV